MSLLKRIAKIRAPRKQAKLSPAELLIQLSLRKRASAFVDARDDLETKIGRLSRRLNFLLTESDLWRCVYFLIKSDLVVRMEKLTFDPLFAERNSSSSRPMPRSLALKLSNSVTRLTRSREKAAA